MFKHLIKKAISFREEKIFEKNIKKFQRDNFDWLVNNSVLNNSATSKECFIIGNGPSIKDFDFKLLRGKDIMTVNQIARNKNFSKLNIKYHLWADSMFFCEDDHHEKKISDDMYQNMISVVKQNKDVVCFVNVDLSNGVVKSLIKDGANIKRYPQYYGTNDYFLANHPALDRAAPGFFNVLQYAIYTAIALGYKKIYLLGSEQTGLFTILNTKLNNESDICNYGYFINEEENKRMKNHFNKFSVALYLHQHALAFDDFEWLNRLAIENHVEIINCTPTTLLDSFERKPLSEVLFNKNN